MTFNTLPPAIELKLINPKCYPQRATDGAAGYDVFANTSQDYQLLPGQTLRVPLGFALSLQSPNLCAILLPRSGLGVKGISLANTVGLIDSDFQGEVVAVLRLRDYTAPVEIRPFDRIAQLIFMPVVHPYIDVVEAFTAATLRDEADFGSTGIRGDGRVYRG